MIHPARLEQMEKLIMGRGILLRNPKPPRGSKRGGWGASAALEGKRGRGREKFWGGVYKIWGEIYEPKSGERVIRVCGGFSQIC